MINVHIERVVLDQVPVSAGERSLFQATIETELKRLLRIGGLSDELSAGGAVPRVRTAEMRFGDADHPANLGYRIAHAVHGRIGRNINGRNTSVRGVKETRNSIGEGVKR